VQVCDLSLELLRVTAQNSLFVSASKQRGGFDNEVQPALCSLMACSEYISSEVAPGTIVRTTRHEDLQHTSFSNATFDLIISSEVWTCPRC
jgi:hypothetical protein